MGEAQWLLVVYRLPPHHARLHAEVQLRLEQLEPIHMQRFTVLTHDTAAARAALLDLRRNIESQGGTLIILSSAILAGPDPAAREGN